jgi:flagellar protein FlbC
VAAENGLEARGVLKQEKTLEAAHILLPKSSSPYPAPETGGYGIGMKDGAGMYEGPGSFTAMLSEAAERQSGDSGGSEGKTERDAAVESGKAGKAEEAAGDTKAAAADTAEKSDAAKEGEKDASAKRGGEKGKAGEKQTGEKDGKSDATIKSEGKEKDGPEVKRDPKIINIKTSKKGTAERVEKNENNDKLEKADNGKKGEQKDSKVSEDPTTVVLEAALAGEKELRLQSRADEAVKAGDGERNGGSGKPAAVTLEMNTEKTEKRFFFIDKRTAGNAGAEKKAEKPAGKEGAETLLKTAAEKSAKNGKAVESRNFQKDAGVEKGEETKTVKEEFFDSSEKLFKVTAEVRDRQTVQQQNDSFGQKHTQSAVLQRHLAEQGNRQIVRQSGIILKDNNSGEIRLVLKPENLGNVRIQLQMQDNTITGKIIVDNSAAKTAFDQNMEDLYKSFKESGFDNANLDVEVGGGKSGQKHERNDGYTGPALHHVRVLEEQIPLSGGRKSADTLIDLVI